MVVLIASPQRLEPRFGRLDRPKGLDEMGQGAAQPIQALDRQDVPRPKFGQDPFQSRTRSGGPRNLLDNDPVAARAAKRVGLAPLILVRRGDAGVSDFHPRILRQVSETAKPLAAIDLCP